MDSYQVMAAASDSPTPMACLICNNFREGQPRDHTSEFTWHELQISSQSCNCCDVLVSGCSRCLQQHNIDGVDILRASLHFYYPNSDESSWEEDFNKEIIFSLNDGRRFQVELFVTEDDNCPVPDSWGMMPTSRRATPRSDSAAALAVIKGWVADCLENHELCEKPGRPDLPTRVVDVGLEDGVVKLIETHGAQDNYICLSHCWGLAQIITTTSATIESRKNAIAWADLSKTFRDAITFTRSLGFNYIWIDSLCIIQDDAKDWEVESSKMATVYSNCQLTLAGTHSANGYGGLFGLTEDVEVAGKTPNGEDYRVYFRERIDHHLEQCEDSSGRTMQLFNPTRMYYPLLTRAWVYQERMLSTRVVHFGHYEVFFECRSGVECECGGIAYHGSSDAAPVVQMKVEHSHALENASRNNDEDIYRRAQLWRTMVATYTSLHLTKSKDRLPAIGGLARNMAAKRHCSYLAGLWSDSINDDLLWTVPEVIGKKPRLSPPTAPSWSWASVKNFVRYWDEIFFTSIEDAHMRPDRPPFEHFVKIEGCQVTPAAVDEFGGIASGELRLTGLLAHGMLEHEIEVHDNNTVTASYFVIDKLRWFVTMDYSVGSGQAGHKILPTKASCLRMSHVVEGSTDHLVSLILLNSSTNTDVFERVGTLVIKARPLPVDPLPNLFREARVTTVTVV